MPKTRLRLIAAYIFQPGRLPTNPLRSLPLDPTSYLPMLKTLQSKLKRTSALDLRAGLQQVPRKKNLIVQEY
jgi:hypothetical protein